MSRTKSKVSVGVLMNLAANKVNGALASIGNAAVLALRRCYESKRASIFYVSFLCPHLLVSTSMLHARYIASKMYLVLMIFCFVRFYSMLKGLGLLAVHEANHVRGLCSESKPVAEQCTYKHESMYESKERHVSPLQ